jgi:hypothetical protein
VRSRQHSQRLTCRDTTAELISSAVVLSSVEGVIVIRLADGRLAR